MLKDIVAVKPLEGYQLWLRFEDDLEGVVDISQIISFSGIFVRLQDRAYFTQVQIHPELGTIFWPNGADLDPDVLYSLVAKHSISNYSRAG
ncbi:MAG: DUF2442 domain-containing protein [Oculatellaceae cyanobacterium Prado106]|jgi:hypothetical protein|nr:DUF2442 domain-containing protein [Oculatellaceae cyanobacterium Prado106]